MEYISQEVAPGPSAVSMKNKILLLRVRNSDRAGIRRIYCVACLRTHVDITANIPKQAIVFFCRNCERYLNPPSEWVQCSLESKELLSVCLKRLKGLKEVKLVDAGFIWTEPHSKRIKVKLTVHGEVMDGCVLQQVFVVEFTVNNQMCDDCHRTEAKDFWRCLVQAVLPVQGDQLKKLISPTFTANSYNYKYSYALDVVPISKGSLVCLGKKLQTNLGHISPICLVTKVANAIHLIDPRTAQMAEVQNMAFWKSPFEAICNPKHMVEFVVMDVEIVRDNERKNFPGQGPVSFRHVIADVWVVKASELGINENTIHTRSHLGHLLKVGDSVLGYDLAEANINNGDFEKLKQDAIPELLLVKKYYDKSQRKQSRNWKLKHLTEDVALDTDIEADYSEFLEDLEEDPEMRQGTSSIFKDAARQQSMPVDVNDMADPSVPRITLEEMLDDLVLDDVEMGDA
ncbi:hypothetical protein quinque_005541 [Culex quinquefasciatus]